VLITAGDGPLDTLVAADFEPESAPFVVADMATPCHNEKKPPSAAARTRH
jgi:hypothetical protein